MTEKERKIEFWTNVQVELLKKYYPSFLNRDLSRIINKSISAISGKAQRLRIKKDWQFMKKIQKNTSYLRYQETS